MSYDYINSTGLVSADTSDVLTEVQQEFITALNLPNLNLDAETAQGTLIAAEVLTRQNIMKNNVEMANLMNPNYSYEIYLDAIAALLGLQRGSDTYTTGTAVAITGVSGTIIPAGSRVTSIGGDTFTISTQVTIGTDGTASGTVIASSAGAIALAVGAMTIVDGVVGWGAISVTSSTAVVLGTSKMTDSQFKTFRRQSLFAQGRGPTGAIQARLLAVSNVDSVKVVENVTGQIATAVNGITFTLPNAVYICVAGAASDADIAAALWKARGGMPTDYGAANQGTQVDAPNGTPVTDADSGIVYYVKFNRATQKTVYIKITANQGTSTASDQDVINTVVSYSEGDVSGMTGVEIGTDISSYEIAGAISNVYQGLFLTSVLVAVTDVGATAPVDSDYSDLATINPWEIGVVSSGNISVSIS